MRKKDRERERKRKRHSNYQYGSKVHERRKDYDDDDDGGSSGDASRLIAINICVYATSSKRKEATRRIITKGEKE